MNDAFFLELLKQRESGKKSVVVTLIYARGSAPQESGARIIVNEEGLLYGTVGGGKVEVRCIERACLLLKENTDHLFIEWNLQKDIGMTCGGVVGFYFEKLFPTSPWKIAIFGAGHVAQELIPLLLKLDCSITWIDPRKEWLAKIADHPKLTKIQAQEMHKVVNELSKKTYIACMTMGHAFDLPILIEAMKNSFPYVGVIGSLSKARTLKNDLKNADVEEKKINELHCPIGEPIGNNNPVEIAFSIVAQLLKVRDLS